MYDGGPRLKLDPPREFAYGSTTAGGPLGVCAFVPKSCWRAAAPGCAGVLESETGAGSYPGAGATGGMTLLSLRLNKGIVVAVGVRNVLVVQWDVRSG